MHPDIEQLRRRGLDSIQLAIELFNRPHDCARPEAVLILLHHSFEMMIKSFIVERTGTVFDTECGYSYAFDTCLRMARERLDLITEDHRKFLSILDNLRDSATHYYQEISESMLYIFAQASVSLFNELIRKATGKGLLDFLPSRVLPISAIPPQQLGRVLDDEFSRLRELLRRPGMTRQQATAILRPLMAFKIGGEETHRRMTPAELDVAVENLSAAANWRVVFPEIARIELASDGDGIAVGFKVVKETPEAMPVRVLKADDPEPAGGVIIQKEVNIFDKFNLGLYQLAEKLGISGPRTTAMIREHKLDEDSECFRQLRIGSQCYKRYSMKALELLRGKIANVEEVWQKHRLSLSKGKKARP